MVEEVKLAWALAQVADPYLTPIERNDVYVAIGIGETFSAICFLITAVVREGLALPSDVVKIFTAWLDAYVGHDDEPHLRELISRAKPPAM